MSDENKIHHRMTLNPYDDSVCAEILTEMRNATEGYPTIARLTASLNYMVGVFRLCCVCGDKKDVLKIADDFHKVLIKEINLLYSRRDEK